MEYDSIATRGSTPKAAAVPAAETAMSASWRASGLGTTAQSPYTSTRSGSSMKNTLDTTDTSGAVRMISNAGRMVCAVVCTAPDTIPSASPRWTMSVPKYDTSTTVSWAMASVTPLWARSRAYSSA